MFLNSFDDARHEDGRNAVPRAAQRKQTEADDDIEEVTYQRSLLSVGQLLHAVPLRRLQ